MLVLGFRLRSYFDSSFSAFLRAPCTKNILIGKLRTFVKWTLNEFIFFREKMTKMLSLSPNDWQPKVHFLWNIKFNYLLHRDIISFVLCFIWFVINTFYIDNRGIGRARIGKKSLETKARKEVWRVSSSSSSSLCQMNFPYEHAPLTTIRYNFKS